MNWRTMFSRGTTAVGDAADGAKDGQYDHAQTEARMGREARRLATKAGDNPVTTAYVIIGLVIVFFVAVTIALWP
jgi:hypothetical protein